VVPLQKNISSFWDYNFYLCMLFHPWLDQLNFLIMMIYTEFFIKLDFLQWNLKKGPNFSKNS
jgi:hypothetical protein